MKQSNLFLIVGLILLAILVFKPTTIPFAIQQTKETSCFNYIDDDGDRLVDLDDTDCMSEALTDYDSDGYMNVDEYEAGSNLFDATSVP